MVLSWLSVDARTGVILADLPGLAVPTVKRSICRYEPATAALPLPTAPENWMLATRHGGANLILLSDGVPIWGGMVTQRPRSSGDVLPLSLATVESYLDRRFVGDVTYTGVGQNAIVADIIARYVAVGPHGGIPIRVQYATVGAGQVRDRTYTDASDKTVYSALTELAAVDGGPEWTIEWEWQHNPERITPVLYVGDRIGRAATPGLAPAATFEMPGCVIEATLVEDYSSGKAANSVIAVSTATADVRPQSPVQVPATDDGRPTFETRFTPSTSITLVDTLTSHAQSALAYLAPGGMALSMSAAVEKAPALGVDWVLGDDIGYKIGGLEPDRRTRVVDVYADQFVDVWVDQFFPIGTATVLLNPDGRDSVPAFPGGLVGTDRCVGWELTLDGVQTVTPILASTGA